MTQLRAWVSAFRLRTLPLALSSIIMGGFLAAFYGSFSWAVLLWASLTTLFLQVLSNLANDYGDTVNGADHAGRQGPQRMVQAGLIAPKRMKVAIVLFVLFSFISGIALIITAFQTLQQMGSLLFFVVGLLAIAAAMKYTMGKNPYGYNGLGDLFVLLFFGLVGVGGSFYLHHHRVEWEVVLPALSVGLLSSGVLNLNNMRDEQSDTQAGKRTLVVKNGLLWAKRYHFILIITAMLCSLVFVLVQTFCWPHYLFILSLPLFIRHLSVVRHAVTAENFDPELKKLALSTLLYVILFGSGLVMC
ncbi:MULTISPECIES: 1,4-dihydroxy-2-naphthoate polyprenyltransferase [unclassified Carboxylicivirga]|uniref:1,4-dihydroxy-2-naphthoate polyprenyltransferase n=1 Tax=Carboxylicivirga TaxID=1628153 RepID=UPI003D3373AF